MVRAVKWTVFATSFAMAVYSTGSALVVARAGTINGIDQLAAAGAAETIAGLIFCMASFLAIWRLWVAAVVHGLNMLWCSAVAAAYGDVTVWLWCGVAAIHCGVSVFAGWRQRKYHMPSLSNSP
ncbi:hypothetical protein C7445_11166 [Alicyclobacillus sacchari]|uniref:Transmembrane protein n=1 Tax=Alicyclobacillus sacchari TaxID=392010 RepID=A0A4R8LJ64_9BACL|nr:hypothetical protein [Alicyclobacillus sacchari]TDY43418.1 hypothetical protein C7445_11166 [Alicyclobacillus sacchari]GMA55827.1 hypothetical protein GCM10025858_03300 [Alicyclobacillus sacchari]